MPYDDPRLVALYDEDNPPGEDAAFLRARAAELGARRVIDLGCGTGIMTVELMAPGRTVIGVDPSPTMLDVARRRPRGDAVTWILGDSRVIPRRGDADLAVMTGNVAQHIVGDAFARACADIAGALRPGGVLVFDARNPADRAWERWAVEPPTARATPQGPLREWMEIPEFDGHGVLRMRCRNVLERTGEEITEILPLEFRSRDEIEEILRGAGFDPIDVYGAWRREPFRGDERIMVFEARRA